MARLLQIIVLCNTLFLSVASISLIGCSRLLADNAVATQPVPSVTQTRPLEPPFKADDTIDYVSLYYFDDVPRLMQVLRSNSRLVGGNSQLITNAETQSQTLITDDLSVSSARQKVDDARRALGIKRSILAEATRKRDESKLQVQQATARQTTITEQSARLLRDKLNQQNSLQATIDNETTRVTTETASVSTAVSDAQSAQAALATDPQNSDKQKAVKAATRTLQSATARLKQDNEALGRHKEQMMTLNADVVIAQRNDTALQQDVAQPVTEANAAVTQAQGEVNTAEGDIATAVGADHTAETNLQTDRDTAAAQAFIENHAFALSRDNQPYWYAPHDPATSDPLQRVALAGFPDSKRILIRGSHEDIDAVKAIIGTFDRPQAQALMTLFTVEISSKANKQGAEDTSKALRLLQNKLAVTSQLMNQSMDDVRRGVLIAVDVAAEAAQRDTRYNEINDFPSPEHVRLEFYDPQVLNAFGINSPYDNPRQISDPTIPKTKLLLRYLPDPKDVTTPAEALVALSLAGDQYEQIAANTILSGLRKTQYYGMRQLEAKPGDLDTNQFFEKVDPNEKVPTRPDDAASISTVFANAGPNHREVRARLLDYVKSTPPFLSGHFAQLGWWLGKGGQRGAGAYNFQKELIFQLQSMVTQKLISGMEDEFKTYAGLRHLIEASAPQVSARVVSKPSVVSKLKMSRSIPRATYVLGLRLSDAEEHLETYYEAISELPGNHPEVQEANILKQLSAQGKLVDVDKEVIWIKDHPASASAPKALAREAAINETLKQALKAINDDLDAEFVEPMFDLFRSQVAGNRGVAVGIVQRTSILASNRSVARVSPNASADLELGREQNVLADLTDLVKLIDQVGVSGAAAAGHTLAAGATGGLLSAIPVEAAFQLPSARHNPNATNQTSSALEALDRLPNRTTPPGVYGLTTGNTFEVTPVVDPSGQAMQFKFDHVLSSHITEPDGTTNTILPRIERHSMNTEVQLTNNEIRMISQFDSNAKLGLPTKYLGGIPIIREFFPRVPILGYFIKTSGEAAEVQQSLVLAQATMFPTIGDVIGLLTEQN